MHARGACNEVCDLGSSFWVQFQLRSFHIARASFWSQMDVERIQKGMVCC